MDSRLVRIFCANLPSQKARCASYNLLLLLIKDCLFCHRSECYGPPFPSISLESIKSQFLSGRRRGVHQPRPISDHDLSTPALDYLSLIAGGSLCKVVIFKRIPGANL